MATYKTKYGTTLNLSGLTPEQIAKVKQTAEGNGAYGTKAASMADAMRKAGATQPNRPPGVVQNRPGAPMVGTAGAGTGTPTPVDAQIGAGQVGTDAGFNGQATNAAAQPAANGGATQAASGMTQQAPPNLRGAARAAWYASQGQSSNPADVGIQVGSGSNSAIDENAIMGGAPKLFGADDLLGEAGKVRDANYAYLSRDFAQNKATEIENKKQELANRGIPYSDDPNSPYGKAIREIDTRYSDLDAQARNQAIAGGNDTISTFSNAAKGNFDSFLSGVLGLTDAELKNKGLNQADIQQLRALKSNERIARLRSAGSGGSNISVSDNAPGW